MTIATHAPETRAAPAAPRIRSWLPSPVVFRVMNPIVSAILRSPLHGLVSGNALLLSFTGRRTGRRYSVPVGYVREGDAIIILSGVHSWWKNLRGGAPVSLWLQGRQRTAHAVATDDIDAVVTEIEHLVARFGLKGAGQRVGLGLEISPPPSRDEIAEAVHGSAVIRVRLDD